MSTASIIPSGITPACPLCEAPRTSFFTEEHGFHLRRCNDCSSLFVHPQPEPKVLNDLVEDRARRAEAEDYYGAYLRRERGLREHARRLLRLLGPVPRAGRLFEVGCGAGFFLDEARRGGWHVAGIEPNRVLTQHARETLGLEVEPVIFEEFESRTEHYDALCLFDLLSHLRDPRGSLRRAHDCLNPGGRLLVQGGLKAENRRKPPRENWETPFHLFHYTRPTLRTLIEGAGFRIESEFTEAKVSLPAPLSGARLERLRELARPMFPLLRWTIRKLRGRKATDRTVYILARKVGATPTHG